jgi:hypothetical protein
MNPIVKVLMRRDDYNQEDAEDMVKRAKEDFYSRLGDGEMPFDICEEWFGLEPDYVDDLI